MKLRTKLGLLGATFLTAAVFGLASPAAAQDAPPLCPDGSTPAEGGVCEEEAIVVTGSRLRRETFDSPNPTVQVGQEELIDRQMANVGDAIEDIPLIGFGGNTRGANVQNGDSFILPDILDLGSQRTLTLLNGRRIQPTLPGTVFVPGNASGSQVDLSTINPAMIERVEVVAGTGGAIYGADAVGGVVNIITRDDFVGLELAGHAGVTELGDGEQYRIGGIWGEDFGNERGNIVLTVDYFNQDLIATSDERPTRYLGSGITNPLNGSVRDANPFDPDAAADALRGGLSIASAFLPSTADGMSSTFFGPLSLANPLASLDGVLLTRHQLSAGFGPTSQVVPALPVNGPAAAPGQGPTINGITLPFFAPAQLAPTGLTAAQVFTALAPGLDTTGLSAAQLNALALNLLQRALPTPYEHLQNNPTLNPLLFLGTFGTVSNITSPTAAGALNAQNGYFPTIANTDPATSAIFPRIAVPLHFDGAGNLVAYNPGDYGPDALGLLGSAFNGQGYDATREGHAQIQAGTERASFGAIAHYDLTDQIRWRSELFYSDITFSIIGAPPSHTTSGSTQAGTLAVPIFVDQNPFLNSASLATINSLAASGLVLPTFDIDPTAGVDSQRVLYLGRNMSDLFGSDGVETEAQTTSYRIMQALEGDFELAGREFYWDAATYYGRSETISTTDSVLDIEYALAIDVVTGPGGQPVCRQQTLAAPQPISTFNPGVGAITHAFPAPVTPTPEQVAACVPLNLFGAGAPSAAAIDYVTTRQETAAINTLEVYSGSIGGEILRLPAGWLQIGLNLEQRIEGAEFEPGPELRQGLTQTALQFVGGGERNFVEYGYEVLLPVFGEGFNLPLFRELEFNYAWRFVERSQSTDFFITDGTPTYDDTFNYSFRWKPVEDLTLRGARGRTVRSASLVELFDPGIRAFGGVIAASHPCDKDNITAGPAPATRRANCIAAVLAYGYAPDQAAAEAFLATFDHTAGAPNRPATAAGNPFLANEESNAYSIGITYEPSFVPRLTFAADFFSVDLSGELGLVGTPTTTNACFDSPSFPNSVVGSNNPACDAILFTTPGGLIPTVNPLTGNTTILTTSFGGQPANPSGPFEIAAIDFINLNLAVRELRAVNVEVRYDFALGDLPLVGHWLENAGDLFLRGSVYQTQRYDVFTPTLARQHEEHTFPEYQTRVDIRHRVGPFDHTLQWFWNSDTVTDVQVTTPLVEQAQNFIADDTNFFNYFASYDVTDAVTMRLVVNNLTDTEGPRGQYGNVSDFDGGIGREFILGFSARF